MTLRDWLNKPKMPYGQSTSKNETGDQFTVRIEREREWCKRNPWTVEAALWVACMLHKTIGARQELLNVLDPNTDQYIELYCELIDYRLELRKHYKRLLTMLQPWYEIEL